MATGKKIDRRQAAGSRPLHAVLIGAAAIVTGSLLLQSAASAQETEEKARDSREVVMEEVVTTARRREESLQEVPLSVTIFSGEALEEAGVADIVEIAKFSPNVTLEVSRGTNSTLSAFIRGVGQQDPVAGFESGVGLYVDDVYFNRPHAAVLDLYDVERIEVLRGPQGTLYGRNTIGGAIRYVTRPLSDTSESRVRIALGTYGQMEGLVSGSKKLSDKLKVGGAAVRLLRGGFGDNLNLIGVENYNKDVSGLRFSAELTPVESLRFQFRADYTNDQSDPKAGHRLQVGGTYGAPILPNVFDTRAGLDVPNQSVKAQGTSLVTEWDISDSWMLKNILAYRHDVTWSPIDFDSLPEVDLDVPVTYKNRQVSEELQLLYSGDKVNGILGYYYLDANASNEFDVILGQLGDAIGVPGFNASTFGDVDTSTWSLFGDVSYDISDEFSVSVGGRYTSDERSARVLRRNFAGGLSPVFGGSAVVIGTTSDFSGSETFTDFSPRASFGWQLNDQHNAYVSYSEGFKGGGFDPRGQTTSAPDLDGNGTLSDAEIFEFMSFRPETVKSYEIGLKSRWFDDRMTTSMSVFYGDYQDVQIPGSIGVDTDGDGIEDTFTGVTTNAAEAEMPGAEFEGLFQANDNWSFNWALGYLDAKYKKFISASGADVADMAVFQNTPKWTASGSMTFETAMPLFGTPGDIAIINSLSYRDDASQFEFPNPLLDQKAFTLWDMSLVWRDADDHWVLGLHGKNLTDEEYKVAGYNFPTLGLEGNVTAFYGYPRTVTAVAEYKF